MSCEEVNKRGLQCKETIAYIDNIVQEFKKNNKKKIKKKRNGLSN